MSTQYNPVFLAFVAGLFTWGLTALGASMVLFFKRINQRVLNLMMGFASGVMIAASFWSLLLPAIDLCEGEKIKWLPIILGFGLGCVFLYAADKLLPYMSITQKKDENRKESFKRCVLLVLSVTVHNIPEGLSFGVAFGLSNTNTAALSSAVILALAIGLQNFPEGAVISVPLRREGMGRAKSFMYGQLSGLVEPVAAVFGALLAMYIEPLLPYALSFAAGAMIYVVIEELIPESQKDSHLYGQTATIGAMIGFMLMTLMDIAIG